MTVTNATTRNAMQSTADCIAILAAAGISVVKNTGRVARTYRVYRPGATEAEVMTLRQLRQLAADSAA